MTKVLNIKDYKSDIKLFEEYVPEKVVETNKEQLVDAMLFELFKENVQMETYEEKRELLYGNINTLSPNYVSRYFVDHLDQLLQIELKEKELTDTLMLSKLTAQTIGKTKITLWQGDITTLKIDAIVNAANNQMQGCFRPLHKCIDNIIHSAAGVQLRDDCNLIMQKQGFEEPTGIAKITRAYNLPSKFILHTVGPFIQSDVTGQNRVDLANSYISCLELCKEAGSIKSVAFCCISTGVFGYPADEAAEIAYKTVTKWLGSNPGNIDLVVFNVFTDKDKEIYDSLAGSL